VVFRILADATVVLHLVFVAFVVCGGLLVLRSPRIAWAHLPAVNVGHVGRVRRLDLPADAARDLAAPPGWRSDVLVRICRTLFVPLLYPPTLSRETQWMLGGLVILVNAVVYAVVLRHSAILTRVKP
jgi:hypothetical protein